MSVESHKLQLAEQRARRTLRNEWLQGYSSIAVRHGERFDAEAAAIHREYFTARNATWEAFAHAVRALVVQCEASERVKIDADIARERHGVLGMLVGFTTTYSSSSRSVKHDQRAKQQRRTVNTISHAEAILSEYSRRPLPVRMTATVKTTLEAVDTGPQIRRVRDTLDTVAASPVPHSGLRALARKGDTTAAELDRELSPGRRHRQALPQRAATPAEKIGQHRFCNRNATAKFVQRTRQQLRTPQPS